MELKPIPIVKPTTAIATAANLPTGRRAMAALQVVVTAARRRVVRPRTVAGAR